MHWGESLVLLFLILFLDRYIQTFITIDNKQKKMIVDISQHRLLTVVVLLQYTVGGDAASQVEYAELAC